MVEKRPLLTILSHVVLILGVLAVIFPVYLAFVASTHPQSTFLSGVTPLLPGDQMLNNYGRMLMDGNSLAGAPPLLQMLQTTIVVAVLITIGKVFISFLSAYAIVYFRFPFRGLAFWTIFVTLMLPVEVRIIPTFEVVANLGLLNSYAGLTLPLIASATATFLFRQFFLTVPDELAEAARVDGAGPLRFMKDILLPLSRTNIAALCVIMFIYGWVQYLWPMLITTDQKFYTIVMGIKRLLDIADGEPQWNIVMAGVMLAMLPPVLVVIFMQRLFVKGLVETEK
ncbi:sn-glycerol-3-phosphate ABC transporter permease UgpE [Ketogulonicigenium vulgare]|uniref:sn-glycerol-3-phosphate transport system permease protein UgpE n=1 Tax=Ketogulonicigenium vulgare (strain WSH-001) TaxID=759362 RepID=F9Y5S7_KETVW|nr:sn-glycerol-3-phosphate ABC transporter permease UgpE [Ketogulonicigenium vulgare]ADO43739.1 putative permease component of ABC transporter [Ketogulonicigenium vulgare Y25]AEM42002.1 putative sugar ABC transporter Permease protein [Ketogulonicigenium vulgare WSH-001]ALJ82100.1 glycerol-3-phosphate transporter [Ketogulonicigenium vulgare]ANW34725.1 glycerol-3-phosphate transporter [Ketogulonicigenium vulgare]AOZ55770.1 permease of ABC transporter [Ketogulonicigenium vulgare]